ncbi:MAG: outer membrane beta-barrel family protein [Bacteroidales bacterium]|nr:outer membrane beta-barrel family protein [Bacteroidales bacterium]
MKNVLLSVICLLVLLPTNLSAQKIENQKVTLSGIVVDSLSGKSIEYPTIALFTDSLKLIKAVAGGADGKFVIEAPCAGKYILSASMIGYTNSKNEISLDGSVKRKDIGKISITEGLQIAEVTVVGVKPLIKNEPDKLTYNLEADPQTSSSSVIDILRKVPMLSVDGEDAVRVNGETNFKVLVNGKSSGMLVKNFKQAIKAMPASAIKSIEVITNPPAKYDAEGIGGIINIITNKKTTNGYSGSLNAAVNTLGGYNSGGYISAQTGKLTMTANLYNGKEVSQKNLTKSESENFISDNYHYTSTSGTYKSNSDFTNLSLEASYEIDSLNLLTLSGWGYLGSSASKGSTIYNAFSKDWVKTRMYENKSSSDYGYGQGSGSISYQKSYKKPEKNLTISYSIDLSPMRTNIDNTIDPIMDYTGFSQRSDNDATGTEHTAQIDYYNPINKKHNIETGIKYILRQNISDTHTQRYDEQTGSWYDDMTRVNDLDYNQHIGSLYGGYSYKHKSYTAKAGFRMEYTYNDGLSKSAEGNIPFDNKQFDVVPYINLSYMLKKGRILSFSYTQRLSRPGIWYLNPYVNDSDPMNISYGNPNLESIKRNSLGIGYRRSSQNWNIGLNLGADFTKNSIERVSVVDGDGIRTTTYKNIGKSSVCRLGVSYSYRHREKFNLYINGAVSYAKVSSTQLALDNSGFNINGTIGSNIGLWKKGMLNLNAYLFGGNVSLQYKQPLYGSTSIGISQRFLKDKLTFAIYLQEPFSKTKVYKYDFNDTTFKMHSENINYIRSANFSIYWRFGKFNANVKKARKQANDDKMNGGGNGGVAKP